MRDPAQYHEASQRPDMGAIDAIPDLIREVIEQNWNRELPRTEKGFVKATVQLSAVALVALLRQGKLSPLMGELGQDSALGKFILTEILFAPNARLTAQCCDVVFGMAIEGKTETQLGVEHGMTRANVSAICTALKDTYSGKPGVGLKSNKAVKKYQALRMGKRAKPTGEAWGGMDKFKTELRA
jgi:hypothetical protein